MEKCFVFSAIRGVIVTTLQKKKMSKFMYLFSGKILTVKTRMAHQTRTQLPKINGMKCGTRCIINQNAT